MTDALIQDEADRLELAKAISNRLDVLAEISGPVKPGVRLDDTDLGESVRRCNALVNRLKQMPVLEEARDRVPADAAAGGTSDK
ncbi:MAG: hypothetical protein ACR2OO_05185 [Thermomicrobiales bacterium]